MKKAKLLLWTIIAGCTCGTALAITRDFGRRYGANSRLLQRPLYFKKHDSKNCDAPCFSREEPDARIVTNTGKKTRDSCCD